MDEQKHEMALITQVSYGYTDNGVGMIFGLQLLNGATFLFMDASTVTKLLTESKIGDITRLRGRPCAVNVDENKVVTFSHLL